MASFSVQNRGGCVFWGYFLSKGVWGEEMLVGIDVGGTFTDGVLYKEGEILKAVKGPTRDDALQASILSVLDDLLAGREGKEVRRVVLSTTLVTNLLATGGRGEGGHDLDPRPGPESRGAAAFPRRLYHQGATDFRGRIIEPIDPEEVKGVGREIAASGVEKVAVIGKFSQRNSSQEEQVAEILQTEHPPAGGGAGLLRFPASSTSSGGQ